MKTYLFDTINRYKRFSEKLDVQTAICNKSWWVFNDSGEKELYIFNPDGSLDVSFGGRVTEGKWRYVSANKSIIITANTESFMLDPEFIDNAIFALKLNGTNQYVFMIDENNTTLFAPKTYKELMGYFEMKHNRAIALEQSKLRKLEQKAQEESRRKELEKRRDQEELELREKELSEKTRKISYCRDFLSEEIKWIFEHLPRVVYLINKYFHLYMFLVVGLSICVTLLFTHAQYAPSLWLLFPSVIMVVFWGIVRYKYCAGNGDYISGCQDYLIKKYGRYVPGVIIDFYDMCYEDIRDENSKVIDKINKGEYDWFIKKYMKSML